MSTFVVSDKHINTLVTYAILQYIIGFDEGQKWAELLLRTNQESVNAVYKENFAPDPIKFRAEPVSDMSAVQILKACRCYEYQASHEPNYRDSKAAKFIKKIEAFAVNELPGYAEAKWEIV